MAEVVAREGLTGTTLSKVAEAAGLQRTLVLHYFGTRDNLVHAFVTQAVAAYGTAVYAFDGVPLPQVIDMLFATGAYREHRDLVIWLELVAFGARDATMRAELGRLWRQVWLPDIAARIAAQYPSAAPDRVRATSYALVALFEGHWSLAAQDVHDEQAAEDAKAAARILVSALGASVATGEDGATP